MKKKIILVIVLAVILIYLITIILITNADKKNEDNNITYEEEIKDTVKKDTYEIIYNTTIMGNVELKRDNFFYIFGGQHFGELGYEIEEYTTSNINNKNQICIDYITLEKYDTNYIKEGDLLICRGDLIKKNQYNNDFDTKDNEIIVLKSSDYSKMIQNFLNNTKNELIATVGQIYDELGYIFLKFNLIDSSHNGQIYTLPFVQKVYITEDSKIKGKLEKGKNARIEYSKSSSYLDRLELDSIEIIQ